MTPPKYLLATDWTIKVSSVIKSPANLSPASTLQVRLKGGIYKDLNFHPDDSPPFEVGGTYLLFLSINPDNPARTLWNAPEFESMVLIGSSLEAPTIGPGQKNPVLAQLEGSLTTAIDRIRSASSPTK